MTHLLRDSAAAYLKLSKVQYIFILGHKGRRECIKITFPSYGYHHLAGFHYLKSISQLANKRAAPDTVIREQLSDELIPKDLFDEIRDRLQAICDLNRIIENNRLIFYYCGFAPDWSKINAKYLIKYSISDLYDSDSPYTTRGDLHFFINGDNGVYTPASVFVSKNPEYSKKCPRWIVLKTIKQVGDICQTIYQSPNYRA